MRSKVERGKVSLSTILCAVLVAFYLNPAKDHLNFFTCQIFVFQCLIPSWYMAMDMQMYIFAYLIGALVKKMQKLIPFVLSFWSIVALLSPAITIAYTKYWGTYLIFTK